MAISRRKTVLAIVKEITEGVPVKPTLATHYTALQEGFTMQPSFDVLSNSELKASIGKAKDELGSENPTAAFSHYIKASGIEGQAPDYSLLLEAVFGFKQVNIYECTTEVGSTVSSINHDEDATLLRGHALLIKDPVNGFKVRNILTNVAGVAGLAQNISNPPGTGVLLGKPTYYKASDEGHPTFTVWYYNDGGVCEMMAGARVTEMSISIQAGQYINASFSIGGVSYSLNPIIVTANDTKIDFLDEAITRVATIAAKAYKDPHELSDAVAVAMNALGSANDFTCVYSNTTGKFTITSSGAIFSLLFGSGTNIANSANNVLGYSASDKAAALTYLAENAIDIYSPFTPAYDSTSAVVAKDVEVLLGSSDDIGCFKAQSVNISISNTKSDIADLCEVSGKSGSLITQREVKADITYLLSAFDADKFKRFREGSNTQLAVNFGVKSGGQWVPGKVCNVFLPTTSITSFEIQDNDGLCIVNISLKAYVDNGQAEIFMNFL